MHESKNGTGRKPSFEDPRVRIMCYFPPGLAATVRAMAERERRPLTAQVQILVERALEREQVAAA